MKNLADLAVLADKCPTMALYKWTFGSKKFCNRPVYYTVVGDVLVEMPVGYNGYDQRIYMYKKLTVAAFVFTTVLEMTE